MSISACQETDLAVQRAVGFEGPAQQIGDYKRIFSPSCNLDDAFRAAEMFGLFGEA